MTRTTAPDPVRAGGALALGDGRVGRRVRDRRHLDAGADRRHDAAERAGLRVPVGGEGRRRLLPYVNANGGVNKRKIKYVYKDDALRPVQDASTRRASSSSRTRSSRSSTASAPSRTSPRAPYLNAIKVPQLFVASGATTFGKDYKQYPWTIGYQPNYRAEGTIYGRYVAKTGGEGAHRRPLPERRLRQGPARRPAQRPRQEGEADRLQAELRRRPTRTSSRRSRG